MKLAQLQSEFFNIIVHHGSNGYPTPNTKKSQLPRNRVAIYADSIEATHMNALGIIFPVFKAFVGESFFNHIAMGYIKNNTYEFLSLENIGHKFNLFIQHETKLEVYFFAQDLLIFEETIHRLTYAYSSELALIEQEALTSKPADKLCFKNSEHIALLTLDENSVNIWTLHQQESINEIAIKPPKKSFYLIEKLDGEIKIQTCDAAHFIAFKQLFNGINFEALCEKNTVEVASHALTQSLQNQWISILN